MEKLYATDVSIESKSILMRGIPIDLEYDTVVDGIYKEENTIDTDLGATFYGVKESGLLNGFDDYLRSPRYTLLEHTQNYLNMIHGP